VKLNIEIYLPLTYFFLDGYPQAKAD